MLTYAIGFVQDVQLTCFAIILTCMALQDRANRSLRWLACGYIAGFGEALLDLTHAWLPQWLSLGVVMEAPLIGYACIYMSVATFVRRGVRTGWFWLLLIIGALPFFLRWAVSGQMARSATLQDGILAVETAMTALLLLIAVDRETRWPRRAMAAFLSVYSTVEAWRVNLFLSTGKMPGTVAPWVEVASGIVYVVSCSVLPLAFIWMMNSRLLIHLGRLTIIDPLTQLLNRRGLEAAAEHELARYTRTGDALAVAVLDIDHFKAINDQFGHDGGDLVLSGVAGFLRSAVREADVVGRFGGEEFAIVLPSTTGAEARAVVERLRTGLMEQSFDMQGTETRVTGSFGMTVSLGRRELTWEQLQHEADLALYMAKRGGRNVVKLFGEMPSDNGAEAAGELASRQDA